MNYRDFFQKIIYRIINPLILGMIRVGITPNIITTLGFLGNCVATAFFVWAARCAGSPAEAATAVGWGGFIIIASGLFDMMDGRLARLGNMSSTFGALWDSTLDRYSELVSLFGVTLYFFSLGDAGFWWAVTGFLAMTGSVMVSYVRARAEGLRLECKVGLMQRPERVVVLSVGTIVTGLTGSFWPTAAAVGLIALLANITAFWRLAYCYKVLGGK